MNPPPGFRKRPPVSNLERQRAFRARNPGYFNKYKTWRRKLAPRPVAVEATQPATMLALPEPVVSLLPDLLHAVAQREASVAQRESIVAQREPELVRSASVSDELPIVF